ncbi:MAG TPA: hypothetical protein VN414_06965, partial [Methanosarcina sp.]|nr:hypothetical protein [Methanosarcina sp.]
SGTQAKATTGASEIVSFSFPFSNLITTGKKRICPAIFPSTSATSDSLEINLGFFLRFSTSFPSSGCPKAKSFTSVIAG